jgi:D-Tyr-tRNAtyr deacylase
VKQQLNDDAIVKLYNALGQQLKEEKFSMTQGQFSGNMQIPQEAADGLYFLEVSAGGSRWNQQIVLQR